MSDKELRENYDWCLGRAYSIGMTDRERDMWSEKADRYRDQMRDKLCPEGFEYVRGFRKRDGTYVTATCRRK